MRKMPQLTGGRTGEGEREHRGLRKKGRKVMGGRDVKTARVQAKSGKMPQQEVRKKLKAQQGKCEEK